MPSFLAARLSGTLDEVEAVVAAVEQAGGVTTARETVHPAEADGALEHQGALRSIRRRVRAVHTALLAVVTLLSDLFDGATPTITGLRAVLSTRRLLVVLRDLNAGSLLPSGEVPGPVEASATARPVRAAANS